MKSLIAITSVLLTAAAAPAIAQPVSDAPQAVVTYADLNLSTPAGRTNLQQRLAHAVDQVCATRPDPRDLDGWQAYEACRKQAWESIRPQLAQPQLAEAQIRLGR
ncbi:MAG TPA: UrcA family protein [Caulobacteraceae bacterium]|jgi:UrcA family protein